MVRTSDATCQCAWHRIPDNNAILFLEDVHHVDHGDGLLHLSSGRDHSFIDRLVIGTELSQSQFAEPPDVVSLREVVMPTGIFIGVP